MYVLDRDAILEIHKSTIINFGGSKEYFGDTLSKVTSTLSQQYGYFGYEKYPEIFDKAAVLLYCFAKNHCFVDGNKRVAFTACLVLLHLNGRKLVADDQQVYDKCIEVTTSNLKGKELDIYLKELSNWFRENTKVMMFLVDPV